MRWVRSDPDCVLVQGWSGIVRDEVEIERTAAGIGLRVAVGLRHGMACKNGYMIEVRVFSYRGRRVLVQMRALRFGVLDNAHAKSTMHGAASSAMGMDCTA